jgi:hypothetical protein
MRSPFPGMDPYLENPTLWPDVHGRLINVASELLLAQLRPRYFVQIDERLYLADDNDEARGVIIPDIRIRKVGPGPSRGGATAVLAAPGLQFGYSFEFEVHESYLKLVDRESNNVITVIEILSPANKVNNSAGKRDYDAKRRDVLSGGTHFVEIDLLREGVPLVAQPLQPRCEYMAMVWRFPKGELKPVRLGWPMSLRDPLQPIPIPVRPEDPDAVLDLQKMLDIAYERAGYELRVPYALDAFPPLGGQDAAWAKERVASWRPDQA